MKRWLHLVDCCEDSRCEFEGDDGLGVSEGSSFSGILPKAVCYWKHRELSAAQTTQKQ